MYLGDGVYVAFEGVDFILTTENGIEVTNTIFLEFEHIEALMTFAKDSAPTGLIRSCSTPICLAKAKTVMARASINAQLMRFDKIKTSVME